MMSDLYLDFVELSANEWQSFAERQPDANIFHHPLWAELLEKCYGYRAFAITLRDGVGVIRAGLPAIEMKHVSAGRRWTCLPFSDHCSLLPDDLALGKCADALLRSFANKKGSPKIEVRWNLPGAFIWPRSNQHVLHLLKLDRNTDEVLSRIHHSHVRNVRFAQKHGVQVRRGVDLADVRAYYRLHVETRRKQGVPAQPFRYFEMVHRVLIKQGLGFISLAYLDSRCLAGAVFLHWKRTLTYKYGASSHDGLSLRPNHLVFLDAIEWGCANGYSVLDFGRSDVENSGLRVFKTHWGAREMPLYYAKYPAADSSSVGRRSLMPIFRTVIRKSPLLLCRLAGELYYRYFA